MQSKIKTETQSGTTLENHQWNHFNLSQFYSSIVAQDGSWISWIQAQCSMVFISLSTCISVPGHCDLLQYHSVKCQMKLEQDKNAHCCWLLLRTLPQLIRCHLWIPTTTSPNPRKCGAKILTWMRCKTDAEAVSPIPAACHYQGFPPCSMLQ